MSATARRLLLAASALACLAGGEAVAQEASNRTVYPAEWFARFSPSTALDIAAQVPGFTIDNGQEVRGFGGAVGNVVINGARPSAKAESLDAILRRIPAAQVLRAEVVPGSAIGGEYRSRAQVLNIVLTAGASSLSGSAEVLLRQGYTGDPEPSAIVSVLRRSGDTSLSLAASYERRPQPDYGYDRLVRRPSGELVEYRDKENFYHQQDASVSAAWGWEPGAGRAVHLNARAYAFENPLDHVSRVSNDAGPLRVDTLAPSPNRQGAEVGGDAAHPFASGVLKFVGLVRREQFEFEDAFLSYGLAGGLLGGQAQTTESLTGETVGRLVWSHPDLAGWSFESGGELALNTLDSDVDLFAVQASGARVAVPLPVSDVLVEEVRGEAFASGGRKLSPTLAFDAGLAVETSTITVSGDAEAERTLTFFKPRASLEWTPNPDWRLRGAIERLVAQLDFNDFVSGAEFANGRVNSGNPDVEPERTWRFSGVVERRVLTEGKLRLSVYYDRIQMVQDRVPTDLGLDAPGNLGDARRVWLEAVADLPLDTFRVPGGRFNARWVLQDSDVQDPYTGRGRYFSGEQAWVLSANFRQDIKSLKTAWGVDYYGEAALPQYRVNEIDVWNPDNDFLGAFVEHRPTVRTTVKLDVRNLLDRDIVRSRDFFLPDRRTAQASFFEERRRWQGRTVTVSLKRTFG